MACNVAPAVSRPRTCRSSSALSSASVPSRPSTRASASLSRRAAPALAVSAARASAAASAARDSWASAGGGQGDVGRSAAKAAAQELGYALLRAQATIKHQLTPHVQLALAVLVLCRLSPPVSPLPPALPSLPNTPRPHLKLALVVLALRRQLSGVLLPDGVQLARSGGALRDRRRRLGPLPLQSLLQARVLLRVRAGVRT